MSDALEKDLREALQQQAATLDSDIRKRILETDFRPRVHRYRGVTLRRAATLGGAAMIAAVAVVVVALVASQGGRAPQIPVSQPSIPAAFVGWTAQPSRATATRIAIYAKRCRWAAARSHLGSPLIADVRGPYTALLFVDQRDNYERFCIYGPHVGGQGGSEIASLSPFTLRLAPRAIRDRGPRLERSLRSRHSSRGWRDVRSGGCRCRRRDLLVPEPRKGARQCAAGFLPGLVAVGHRPHGDHARDDAGDAAHQAPRAPKPSLVLRPGLPIRKIPD